MFAQRKVKVAMSLLLSALGGMSVAAGWAAPAQAATVLAASADQRIRLSAAPTRVAIAPATQAIGAQPLDAGNAGRVLLVLEGLSATLAPGASYDVFLGPAAGAGPTRDDPGYAGTLNFYDISAATPADARVISFDVTSVLARLRANGEIKNPLAVTFVPDAPPQENSEPAVGRLRLITP
ncbi:MAG: hypothetical protein QOJ84_5543 [Bradyrhizobium sp.]|nr:hypothetical protein [Bradyrhizobium sp.]